mgnify:CR=1 FL=1
MSAYSIVPAADVESEAAAEGCVSTMPRYNVAGTQAVLRWVEDGEGRMSRADALDLMATADWQVEP